MRSTSLIRPFFFLALPGAIVLVALVYGGMEFYHYLTKSKQFTLRSVEVLTAGPVNKEELIKLAGIRANANIFSIDLSDTKEKIEKNPWVYSASVTRALPDKIQIHYVAEEPVAILSSMDVLYYVNKEGKVFYKITKDNSLKYPLIYLNSALSILELSPSKLMPALRVVSWAERSSMVNLSDLGDIEVRGGVYSEELPLLVTMAFPPSGLSKKYKQKRRFFTMSFSETEIDIQAKRAEAVLQHLLQQGKNPKLIRLELGKKIVVKMDQKL